MAEAYARGQTVFAPTAAAVLRYVNHAIPEDPLPAHRRFPGAPEDQVCWPSWAPPKTRYAGCACAP